MGSYTPPRSVTVSQPVLSQPKKSSAFVADISTADAAKKAAKGGMWAAFFVAGVTTLFAIIAMSGGKEVGGINGAALIDAAMFAGIGIGIGKLSRVAAVAGLVIYIAERLYMMSVNGPQGIFLSIALTAIFINSVRGTFAYHRITVPSS
jgi:hypothetical protein